MEHSKKTNQEKIKICLEKFSSLFSDHPPMGLKCIIIIIIFIDKKQYIDKKKEPSGSKKYTGGKDKNIGFDGYIGT